MKIVVDTYAWIELFIGSEKGVRVKDFLSKALHVYTPDIVLAEIARKYYREGVKEEIILKRLLAISEISIIVIINEEVAIEAAKSYLELREVARKRKLRSPSLFDAIVLAIARKLKAKVITGDEHFRSLPETIWIRE